LRSTPETSRRLRSQIRESPDSPGRFTSVNQARYAEYRAMYPGVNAIVGPIVYLGGGAGYRSKTFVTDQDDMAKVLDAQFGKVVKHVDKTRELRVSPLVLKRTKIDNICYEMGQCELSIRRAE
ncbi:type III-A CRISPR-associated RAMP protein Csm5, partial [Mycobacterium tuberculosis]